SRHNYAPSPRRRNPGCALPWRWQPVRQYLGRRPWRRLRQGPRRWRARCRALHLRRWLAYRRDGKDYRASNLLQLLACPGHLWHPSTRHMITAIYKYHALGSGEPRDLWNRNRPDPSTFLLKHTLGVGGHGSGLGLHVEMISTSGGCLSGLPRLIKLRS